MTEDVSSEIMKLKEKMNSKRTEFEMPYSHKPLITKHWLLGFGIFFIIFIFKYTHIINLIDYKIKITKKNSGKVHFQLEENLINLKYYLV